MEVDAEMVDLKSAPAHLLGHESLRLRLGAAHRGKAHEMGGQRELRFKALVDGGHEGGGAVFHLSCLSHKAAASSARL